MNTLKQLAGTYDPEGLRDWVAEQSPGMQFCQKNVNHCILAEYFTAKTKWQVSVLGMVCQSYIADFDVMTNSLCQEWQMLAHSFDDYQFAAQEETDRYYLATRDEVLKFLDEYIARKRNKREEQSC